MDGFPLTTAIIALYTPPKVPFEELDAQISLILFVASIYAVYTPKIFMLLLKILFVPNARFT